MARPINQISQFRQSVKSLLDAMEKANGQALVIDYLGGANFYRDELQKTDEIGNLIYDITPVQMTAAITALAAVKALLEADAQLHGKALARMED